MRKTTLWVRASKELTKPSWGSTKSLGNAQGKQCEQPLAQKTLFNEWKACSLWKIMTKTAICTCQVWISETWTVEKAESLKHWVLPKLEWACSCKTSSDSWMVNVGHSMARSDWIWVGWPQSQEVHCYKYNQVLSSRMLIGSLASTNNQVPCIKRCLSLAPPKKTEKKKKSSLFWAPDWKYSSQV